ncbi:acyltransferase [Zoogloeaceae bacterium G21618-S1]|nr:acyltransferase [Zoogloeaceae bacterium G21618-S1]
MDWLSRKFELSRGGGASNVRPMEGLRGFAVFLVFLVHFVTLIKPWISGSPDFLVFATALHTIGNTGVDLFFVLSGYLIYGSLISRRQQFLRFMSRRVVRIYPAFVAVFTAYVFLSFLFPAENKIPATATEGLFYLIQNFLLLPGLFPIEPMITVAWSLSYEMFYYLLIPLVITLFRLRGRTAIWRTTFFLSVASATAIYCAINGGHVRLIMFISGIVLYEAMNSPRIPSPHSFFGLSALCVGLLCTLLPMEGSGAFAFKVCILFVSFFVLCLVCFRDSSAWLPRVFSWTPLRWLGNMSYSYYLLHGLALKAGFLALSIMLPIADYGSWLFWVLLPPMFALTLIPTSALFLLVERPLSLSPRKLKEEPSGLRLENAPNTALQGTLRDKAAQRP